MTDSQKLDAILERLGAVETKVDGIETKVDAIETKVNAIDTGLNNLSNHVEELGVMMGAMNDRLTEVEKAVNRVAHKVGTTGVPAVGGGRVPRLRVAAKPSE